MKIVFSGGGTAGHINPLLPIIDELISQDGVEIYYLGNKGNIEERLLSKYQDIDFIDVGFYGFKSKMSKNIFYNLYNLYTSYIKIKILFKKIEPDAVICSGGYVTYPVGKAASKLNIKLYLHEQNYIPGKVNKLLSKKASKVFISYEETIPYFKTDNVLYTGNPRTDIAHKISNKNICKDTILFFGGSLGAQNLNKITIEYLNKYKRNDVNYIVITGERYFNDFKNKLIDKDNITIYPYYDDLVKLMASSKLVVCRSGATSVSEIIGLGLVSILIPSPNVVNNHQYYNALSLKNKNACVLVEEINLSDITLAKEINNLMSDKLMYENIKINSKLCRKKYITRTIINTVIEEKYARLN